MESKQEYPKKIYNEDGRIQRVLDIDEHANYPLSKGWADSPAGPFRPARRKRGTSDAVIEAPAETEDSS